ncbi:hypothetical protein M408DRAFT_6843 [Serendipita vermifera MAFF 305830]|uniref:Uncharacterized protein n=1 Tax=Serendipita vermifera MAFF 305830 TaxID=933852 RepID=A0A0C3BJX7_SERVB|nr:hypothetical protein M408DRAFT_6843 [Serendipita vermifera MAFF 305830]
MTMPFGASALSVLAPSASWWWQENDQALLAWDCTDRSHPQFAVVAANTNVTLLTAGIVVLVGIQNNDQCTTNITPNILPGKDYKILLTNIVNYTDIYATSEAFEVHAHGSPYPSGPTPTLSVASTAGANPTASGNSTRPNGAISQMGVSLGGVMALAGTVAAVLGA